MSLIWSQRTIKMKHPAHVIAIKVCSLLISAVLLSNCSGVNVGNALVSSTIALGAQDSEVPSTQLYTQSYPTLLSTMGLGAGLQTKSVASVTLTKLTLHVVRVALLPEVECTSSNSTLPKDWYREKVSMDFDLLNPSSTIDSNSSVNIQTPSGFRTCVVRFLIGPPNASTPGIEIEGTTSLGKSFSIHSSHYHPLVLKSSSSLSLSDSNGLGLDVILHRRQVLKGVDFDVLSEPIEITPASNPVLFSFALGTLRQGLRGYRIKNVSGVPTGDLATPVQEGDAEAQTAVTGEEN